MRLLVAFVAALGGLVIAVPAYACGDERPPVVERPVVVDPVASLLSEAIRLESLASTLDLRAGISERSASNVDAAARELRAKARFQEEVERARTIAQASQLESRAAALRATAADQRASASENRVRAKELRLRASRPVKWGPRRGAPIMS